MGRTYRHYPFIRISNELFPQVELTYQLEDDGASYYGPFPSEYRAREALEAMRPLFKWRSCRPLASRICFEHTIGRCSAPCVGKIDQAGYRETIQDLERFLTGDGSRFLREIERQMIEASEQLMFERASILRDRLAMLRPLVQRQGALQAAISELDCAVVLPSAEEGKFLWLVVRRGRLVATETDVGLRGQARVKRALATAMAAEPPSLTVRQWELDEINIIANWLHQNRESENAYALSSRDLEEVVTEGFSFMRRTHAKMPSRPPAMVAEKAAERVIPGPRD
jgi:excinuclease ABC subunit C